jgi:hypothetical protein
MRAANIDLPCDEYDWKLYHRKVGADEAARELSALLAELLQPVLSALQECSGYWRNAQAARIRDQMHDRMQRYSHLGATDAEPRLVLQQVLQRHLRVELRP